MEHLDRPSKVVRTRLPLGTVEIAWEQLPSTLRPDPWNLDLGWVALPQFFTWISCSLRILGLGWCALRELATGSCWVSRTASRKAFEQLLFSGLAIDHQVLRYFLFMFVLLGHWFGRLIQCHGEGSRIKVETEGRKRVSQHRTNPWRMEKAR